MKNRRFGWLWAGAALLLTACATHPTPLPPLPTATPLPPMPAITAYALAPADSSAPAVVTLDPTQVGRDISPYIYGLAGTDDKDPNYSATLRPGLMRWGGNPSTRYNWALGNAWNAARDWGFRNTNYGAAVGTSADDSVRDAHANGAAMLITIPTIGWVAKNTDQNVQSLNVPWQGGPPVAPGSDAITGYDPAANRALTSVPSAARKNAPFAYPPDPNAPAVYQDEWVAHLVKQFGTAQHGGVAFYAMDNEPDLWDAIHTDVHPTRMGYDDMLARYIEYATAVKDVDPTAAITGPVVWGWTSYFHSALDRGNDNFRTSADTQAHGGTPFLPWFLDQLHQYETKHGRRILDVLDIHYYPQAQNVYTNGTDAATNALRLRATRALWDSRYSDESWIGEPVRLIPRMREWIDANYPGTKLGISEWNFGADTTLNGALAISEVLGIYGREGVYMAAYWRYPPRDSPGFAAFTMYTNFDGKGTTFGDKSVRAETSDETKISSYAALDSKTGRLHLIMVNPQPDKAQTVRVQLPKALPAQTIRVYGLNAQTGNSLAMLPALTIGDTQTVLITLPAYSSTLFDIQP